MLFKLSLRNMKRSYKDYTIYFLTLIVGVALFYMFNSLDSQTAMTALTKSKKEIIKLLINLLSGTSVFVSIILGFLVIYANGFLIRRRKKEFSIYLTLGMGKESISVILIIETLLVGIVSLAIGLLIGIFGSQFMSILVAKLFEADMTKFHFVFSSKAMIKTIAYFGMIFVLVLIFNVASIGRYKLIDLINAKKKNQKVAMKNPVAAVAVFLIAAAMLLVSYYNVVCGYRDLTTAKCYLFIALGSVGTYFVFWSLSGFFLTVLKKNDKIYMKGLNCFVLKQLNNQINTMVISMTLICLMLFVTICLLSGSLSLSDAMKNRLLAATPVDICFYEEKNLSDDYTVEQKENAKKPLESALTEMGYDFKALKNDYVTANVYQDEALTYGDLLEGYEDEVKKDYPFINFEAKINIVGETEYNKLAKKYGCDSVELGENEYAVLCKDKTIKKYQDKALENGTTLTIAGEAYSPKYKESTSGFVVMSESNSSMGVIVVPDRTIESECIYLYEEVLIGDYNATTKEQRQIIEDNSYSIYNNKDYASINAITKISVYDSSIGVSNIVTFIALYLGIIFMITSAAILALKELSEAADNKERYEVLRKIGTDRGMIRKALLGQIGVFFLLPLLLAAIHSVFGIQFVLLMFKSSIGMSLERPVICTAILFIVLYGGYFLATYSGSCRIMEE